MNTWYPGVDRWERIQNAIAQNGFDTLLAVTPENAGYLAGKTDFMATYWRLAGIHAVAIAPDDRKAIVSGEFGVDPTQPKQHLHFPYLGWTESVDIRNVPGSTLPARITSARTARVLRPVQFDTAAIVEMIGQAVRALVSNPRRIGVDIAEVDARTLAGIKRQLPQYGCNRRDIGARRSPRAQGP